MIERASDGCLYMTKIERLRNVIKRTDAHGFNGRFDRLLSANHHHDGFRRALQDPRHQIESAESAHLNVTDYQIEAHSPQHRERFFGRADIHAIEPAA